MERIVITGIGAVTPVGNTFAESWHAVTDGISGIRPVTKCDTADLPWKVAGELNTFNAQLYLSEREMHILDPFVHYAVAASVMAAQDAGLIQESEWSRPGRLAEAGRQDAALGREKECAFSVDDYVDDGGVIIGSSRGGISTIEQALTKGRKSTRITGKHLLSPFIMPATTVSMASSYVAQKLHMKGYCLGISNACSSGANAIGEAYRLLRNGFSGPVLAGGSDASICRLCLGGYGIAGALSRSTADRAGRPFDRNRDGFVLAEGACIMVLEQYARASARGAEMYGEIIGYANTTDAYHQTKPDPEGEARALYKALKYAAVASGQVDYINTHGTATRLGDRAEAEAIRIVFGEKAPEVPASAIKSMTGHMLAASGAFEIATTLMSLKEGIIPPTIKLTDKDNACPVNIVTKKEDKDMRIAVSHSFGFGGVNAVLVLRNHNCFS